MGICCSSCRQTIKKIKDVNIIHFSNELERNCYYSKLFSTSSNLSYLIYLQLTIRHYINRKTKKIKIKNQSRSSLNNNSDNNNNYYVNLNFNVQVKASNHKDINNKDSKDNKDNNNTIITRATQQSHFKSTNVEIPSVQTELKQNEIFSQDAFFQNRGKVIQNADDPRNGPFDNTRCKYPKIVEGDSSYSGEWKNGKRDGIGILSWKDVSKYIGNFLDDIVTGYGKLSHEDGDIYNGYWENFQAEGIGYYQMNKDASYEGYWKKDKQDGFGIENWPKGSNYIGEYIEGYKNGIGILNFEGDGGYEGEFEAGNIGGIGKFYFKDKRKYEGEWKDNKMHGFGIITWPDGKFFEGEFCEDKKNGFGVFYSREKIYMGIWSNSVLDGDIIIIERNKMKKQFWENGKASKGLASGYPIAFEKMVSEVVEYHNKVYRGK